MMDTPKTTEEDFLVNLIDCQSRLASFIYALVMDEEVVQDILQETNLVLWRKANEFREGSFWAWASQVARFKVQTYYRKVSRDRLVFPDTLLEQVADAVQQVTDDLDQRTTALRHCMDLLPQEKRELIVDRYQPDGEVSALADDLGKSPAVISTTLGRIRRQLLQCIEREMAKEEHP